VDGVTGVHVAPRDPAALGSAVAALLADPDKRADLGAAGVRRARERFAHDRVAAATRDVYREVVGAPAAAAARARQEVRA
jgi:glycosyltransferase involved in cell wall biosynthesis